MSNVVTLRPERRPTLAARHLQYFETCHGWLAEQLNLISDEQLGLEAGELRRLIAARPAGWTAGARFVADAYKDEAERRLGLTGFPGGGAA